MNKPYTAAPTPIHAPDEQRELLAKFPRQNRDGTASDSYIEIVHKRSAFGESLQIVSIDINRRPHVCSIPMHGLKHLAAAIARLEAQRDASR